MQIEHDTLVAAMAAVLERQTSQEDCSGVTTKELCASRAWSRNYALAMIDEGLRRGEIRAVKVWRNSNAGYRARIPGWQLCQNDSNS